MAKITVEFDTIEKTLVIKKDGEVIDNVTAAYFYNFGKEAQCSVETSSEDESTDISVYTRIVASDNDEVKKTKSIANALFR